MANNADIMGENMASEITAAEGQLAGTEDLATVRLLMMRAMARGIISEVATGGDGVIDGGEFGPDVSPDWDFGTFASPLHVPDTDYGTITQPTGDDADFGGF